MQSWFLLSPEKDIGTVDLCIEVFNLPSNNIYFRIVTKTAKTLPLITLN